MDLIKSRKACIEWGIIREKEGTVLDSVPLFL